MSEKAGSDMKLALACLTGRREQLTQLISNRRRDWEQIGQRIVFIREQIASAEAEIASIDFLLHEVTP